VLPQKAIDARDTADLVTQRLSSKHIPALDGVRGIAILGVLFVHSYGLITRLLSEQTAQSFGLVADAGSFGVDLFFALSGFLITGVLLDTKDSPNYFRNFYARRFLRLFPVYYAYLFLAAVVFPIVHLLLRTSMADYDGNWWWYILYLCNWKPGHASSDPLLGHFWSLAIEEQFYLLWPAVVRLLPRRVLWVACASMIAASVMIRCSWAFSDVNWNTIYRLTITRLDTLALGALVALALRSPRVRPRAVLHASKLVWLGLGSFLLIGVYAGGFSWKLLPIHTFGALAAGIGFAGVVLYAATCQSGFIYRVLTSSLLTGYGKYSYAIYVSHIAVFAHFSWVEAWLLRHVPASAGMAVAGAVFLASNVVAFTVGKLSWRYFESPILRYKAKFSNSVGIPARTQPLKKSSAAGVG
jgi:peptidoglycan/LPS O-acetylase OafA/YrhL